MKIVFMGTPDFAVESLKALNNSKHEIVGVVTVADKPAGRGKKLTASPVKEYAEKHNLPLFQPEKLKSPEFLSDLKKLQADLFVVVAFRMLPEEVWAMPPKGTINLHGSLLPDYRGAAPINWAIINGDSKSGVTTFFIEKEIDTGKIIDKAEVPINDNTTAGELHDELMIIGANLLVKTVNKIESGEAEGIPQKDLMKTILREAPKLFKETCQINWNRPKNEIHNLIRGLSPYPAAWTNIIDSEGTATTIKIFKTSKCETKLNPGQINCNNKDLLEIGCSDGAIKVLELQLAGKKKMDIKSFLNGIKLSEKQYCK